MLHLITAGLYNYPSQPNFEPEFACILIFKLNRGPCRLLHITWFQGDWIKDANMTFTLCTMYDKSHTISHKRNMPNVTLSLSCFPPLRIIASKSCSRTSTLIFTSLLFLLHYSMASCSFEILRWRKKKNTFDVPLRKNFKADAAVIDLEVIR